MAADLFRKSALEKLSSPEQLNQMIVITSPRSWIALGALGLILAVILVWSFVGSVPVTLSGQGIVTEPDGIVTVTAVGSGVIRFSPGVQVGAAIRKGQILAHVDQPLLVAQLKAAQDSAQQLQTDLGALELSTEKVRADVARVSADARASGDDSVESKAEELRVAEELFEAQAPLVEQGYISRLDYEKTRQQILSLRNEVLRAKETTAQLLAVERQQLAQAEAALRAFRQQVAQAADQVRQLREELRLAGTLSSDTDGELVEISAVSGDTIAAGQAAFKIAPADRQLTAVVFVPHDSQVKRLAPGTRAQIALDAYAKERYGYLLGTVTSVSPRPVGTASLVAALGDPDLAQEVAANGAPVEIRVAFLSDANSRSGYRWSSKKGQEVELSGGSWCSGNFIVEEDRPISLLMPLLKDSVGL